GRGGDAAAGRAAAGHRAGGHRAGRTTGPAGAGAEGAQARSGRPAGLCARSGRAAQHPAARTAPGLCRAVVRAGAGGAGDRGPADLPQTQTQTGQDHAMSNEQPRGNRNRLTFLVIVGIFLGGMLVAGTLRFSGWRPSGMKNNGELLEQPADLRGSTPVLAGGGEYAWNPAERRWRILVAPSADCGDPCRELARELDLVWRLFGTKADEVDILWLGAPPE